MEELEKSRVQRERLEKELESLKENLTAQVGQPSLQPPSHLQEERPGIKRVPAAGVKTIKLATPESPNLVIGIVQDPRGNVLSNILVEVKDEEGNPVRAFKTNALGQFASATPLLDGTYTIEFDDPTGKQRFDAIQLTLNGKIIEPLEEISQDQREELRRSLFSNQAL